MQRIIHEKSFKYPHPVFPEIEHLYMLVSEKTLPQKLVSDSVDIHLSTILAYFRIYGNFTGNIRLVDKQYKKLSLPRYDSKNIIVCTSGGKDSLATILHYRKLGYNVYLYHVTGANKTYYDEYKAVEAIAQKLNLPLRMDDISYKGFVRDYKEHPMKNMVIASMALAYGIQEGVGTKIAFGNFRTSSLQDEDFDTCGGDCIEMWHAYENAVKCAVPGFRVYIPNANFKTSVRAIMSVTEILPLTISCMTPNRFRQSFRERTEKKYQVKLMPNRCGCCWKCALEYCTFTDMGVLEFNAPYYRHCLDILKTTLKKETGYSGITDEDTWNHYFFYSKNKSKL